MKLILDTEAKSVTRVEGNDSRTVPLWSRDAFEWLSREWVRLGWNQKYQYSFSWMGRPIIQLPEDIVRIQEVIYRVQPDVIIETGVAHGGSLVLYASLCKAIGRGRVVGIDIEIRPLNRKAIVDHPLSGHITLIEGSSTDMTVIDAVRKLIHADERVLVLLDSNHTHAHVTSELEAYAPLVSIGSYIVATDGIMSDLIDAPRGKAEWQDDHPTRAAAEFAARHPEFVLEQPEWPFNESDLRHNITHWPGAWLRRC